ncbi:MAG TPA: DUF1080 domain-containing protein [Ohtaekwangia sp.]|nr:DUF1080 domain-containing protein [Ohtaekwangia sp.]
MMINRTPRLLLSLALAFTIQAVLAQEQLKKTPETTEIWEPQPRIVAPADKPGGAPADATVLFDGKSFDNWSSLEGGTPKWSLKDGAMTVVGGSKDIRTKKEFGDFQLHVEWRSPAEVDPEKTGQGRGNSGIFLHGKYEVQVLDNFNNKTYANGQASSVYKQHIPLVNACRKPGEWQTYDIIFTGPRFNSEGRILHPAYVTVIHNGIITQNHIAIWGPTEYIGLPVYKPEVKGPIILQDHGNPVSYRNIWIREL